MTDNQDTWPAGATWVFQGTIAEDATGGTHVCTLTVTPGAGNEIEVLYGQIIVGNTATAQTASVYIDDGTNQLCVILNPQFVAGTTALLNYTFPTAYTSTATQSTSGVLPGTGFIVSGSMRLKLQVSTAALSVTHSLSLVCRIKGAMPTATLADTVGAPVLTTNTNKVF